MDAIVSTPPVTAEEFEAFVNLSENSERLFELIGGEIIEVPSNAYVSRIAIMIATYLNIFVIEHNLGHVTGEAGGYQVFGERYAPDVAFISYARQPELAKEGYNPNPPELAVEVLSPGQPDRPFRIKLGNYLAAGTMVWVVDPETQQVEVYTPGKPVQKLTAADTLNGGRVLPDFTLSVSKIFPAKPSTDKDQS